MRYKVVVFLLLISSLALGVFIPVKIKVQFNAEEEWIPKHKITQSVKSYSDIRLIQLIHWPILKKNLLTNYPMIESAKLSFTSFPNITLNIKEKSPWVMVISNNKSNLYSEDGVLLNQKLNDFELPNTSILIIKALVEISKNNQIMPDYLTTIHDLFLNLNNVPFLNIQQVILDQSNIKLIKDNGLKINLGEKDQLEEKFAMLRYFLGDHRDNIDHVEFIDIQFPKRVIIK